MLYSIKIRNSFTQGIPENSRKHNGQRYYDKLLAIANRRFREIFSVAFRSKCIEGERDAFESSMALTLVKRRSGG